LEGVEMRSFKKILLVIILLLCYTETSLANEKIYDFIIKVNLNENKLFLFKAEKEEKKNIKSYPICGPKQSYYPLPLIGEIQNIIFNPSWIPTEKTKKEYFEKNNKELPDKILSGDKRNAMGKVKIIINFENFSDPIRIHGTNKPKSIGRKESRGCIRMRNVDALEMAKLINNKKTKVIIE